MHAVCQCNYFELLAQLRVGLNLGAYNVASGDGGDANCWRNTRSKRAFAYSRRAKKCPLAPPIRPSQRCHAASTAAYHYPNPCSYSLSCGSNPRCCSMSVQWSTSNASYCRQHDVCLCSDWGGDAGFVFQPLSLCHSSGLLKVSLYVLGTVHAHLASDTRVLRFAKACCVVTDSKAREGGVVVEVEAVWRPK